MKWKIVGTCVAVVVILILNVTQLNVLWDLQAEQRQAETQLNESRQSEQIIQEQKDLLNDLEKIVLQSAKYDLTLPNDLFASKMDKVLVFEKNFSEISETRFWLPPGKQVQIEYQDINGVDVSSAGRPLLTTAKTGFTKLVISEPGWHAVVKRWIQDQETDFVVLEIDGQEIVSLDTGAKNKNTGSIHSSTGRHQILSEQYPEVYGLWCVTVPLENTAKKFGYGFHLRVKLQNSNDPGNPSDE